MSPRRNRVTPEGELVADPARGLLMGNRGILHDAEGRLGVARWRHKHWICCVTAFKGRRRPLMAPGAWTELFFLDEAVALAAGHRPCAECRRADFLDFRAAWAAAGLPGRRAGEIDAALHPARVTRARVQVTHRAEAAGLPDGSFIGWQGAAHLVRGGAVRRYSPAGYGPPLPRPVGLVTVLTPAPVVDVLAAGYRAALHPTAGGTV